MFGVVPAATLGTLLPFLFAPRNHCNHCHVNTQTFIVSVNSCKERLVRLTLAASASEGEMSTSKSTMSMSPPREVIKTVESIYKDLASTGCFSTQDYYSPNVQFKYMSPSSSLPVDIAHVNKMNAVNHDKDINTNAHMNIDMQTVFQHIQTSQQKASHLVASTDTDKDKTILIYIPGLDGVGISATTQFHDLSNQFEFWRMYINDKDTSTSFHQLIKTITTFIHDLAITNNREFILVGESFGGLLVPAVSVKLQQMQSQQLLKGIVLVNPATSFDQTSWSSFVPLLASLRHIERDQKPNQQQQSFQLPTPYSVLGGVALAATIPDNTQYQSIFDIFTQTKVQNTDQLSDILLTMKDGFGILADKLPAQVIEHRVNNWLNVGCMVLNQNNSKRLQQLHIPTLIIAGQDDNMLPTKKEADRLVQIIPNCTSVIVKGSGHFVLDDRFNLTDAILDAPFYKQISPSQQQEEEEKVTSYDPILDWKLPSSNTIQQTIKNRVEPLRVLTSPVFFSTGKDGKRRKGLGFVPNNNNNVNADQKKPLLFVANHQLLGLDLGMIIAQLIEERGINARGLAHPIIFQGGDAFGGGFGEPVESNDDGDNNDNDNKKKKNKNDNRIEKRDRNGRIKDENSKAGGTFESFGAVMVSPRNYYRLMENSQTALLFPGGVREVFHGKDEAYELFWPEKVDFVRVAARFNATIVPISAVGAADSANILIDAPDMLKLPFGLGERAANNTKNVISARYDTNDSEELFQPPFVVPKPLPSRHYFIFGKSFDTTSIGHKDKEACAQVYHDVKAELRRGLDDLLVAREKDPYQNTARRIVYERLLRKQAPTFPIDELNVDYMTTNS